MPRELPVVQRATTDDYESIAQLRFLSHTLSFRPFASERWLNSRRPDHYRHRWRETLSRASGRSLNLAARSAGKTVGMVRVARSEIPEFAPDKNRAELTGMHVAPGLTGKGIGTLLMRRSLDCIHEQDFSRVVPGVIAANTGARRFYEFHGWVLVEEFPTGLEGVPVAIYELA